MFTRKNKGGEVNKKTRKDKDSKRNKQKGGGTWIASEKYIHDNRQGIYNIGNTCYLCALYQLLFSIEEFALLIMNYYFEPKDNEQKTLPKILTDKKVTKLFAAFTTAVKDREDGKNPGKYNFIKNVFIEEITSRFDPVDIKDLLCYLLSQIFSNIAGNTTNKLTYEPVMIPMILFPGQDPYNRQQDSAEAIQELMRYIPQLEKFIGFSQTENKYYKPKSTTIKLNKLNNDSNKQNEIIKKTFSGKTDTNYILKIKPEQSENTTLQYQINKISESANGNEYKISEIDEDKKQNIKFDVEDTNNGIINFYTKEDYSDVKNYIIIYFPRTFTDGRGANEERYNNLIDPDETLKIGGNEYVRYGIICHLGNKGKSGHYIYEDESYSADKIEFDDERRKNFLERAGQTFGQNTLKIAWSMLLYKKKGFEIDSTRNDTKLIEILDKDEWNFVFNNDIGKMDSILNSTPGMLDKTYKDGGVEITALMRQADNGTPDVLQFLVKRGADVNKVDNSNPPRTALDYAISRRKVDNILYLLSVDKLKILDKDSLIKKINSSKIKDDDKAIIIATIE